MSPELSAYNAKDIKRVKILLDDLKTPQVTLSGEKEKLKSDFLVPRTGHFMSPDYINCILKLL